MIKDILPVFRSIKTNLLSGILILFTIYLFNEKIHNLSIPDPIVRVLELNDFILIATIGVASAFIGSLYTSTLEGLVDFIHRKQVTKFRHPKYLNRIAYMFAPFSISSFDRVILECKRFYYLHCDHNGECKDIVKEMTVRDFTKRNLIDILWMEGKLVGTPYFDTYSQYRAEGESRLSIALIIPAVTLSVCYSFKTSFIISFIVFIAFTLVGIKLADDGLYYYRKANSFLAHQVADQRIKTAKMEDCSKVCLVE